MQLFTCQHVSHAQYSAVRHSPHAHQVQPRRGDASCLRFRSGSRHIGRRSHGAQCPCTRAGGRGPQVDLRFHVRKRIDLDRRRRFNDERVAIIDRNDVVHMAHIDIHYGFSVNGVAYLHTEILKNSELNHFYNIYPEKFNNKTNGITFRRWLLYCNEPLTETITEWMRNGAREEDYPIHQVSEGENWDYVLYQHKKLSLYPFTKNAVKNLYNRMGITRTPRYILRDIVEPAVHDIIENRSGFPAFCKGIRSGLSETVDSRINNLVRSLPISEEEQSQSE